jgi:DNA-binding beta-propeller fold protein YncE
MRKSITFFFILLELLLLSCTYSPNDAPHYVEVDPTIHIPDSLTLEPYTNMDTIFIRLKDSYLEFDGFKSDKEIIAVELYINGNKRNFDGSKSPTEYFFLKTTDYFLEDGTYTMDFYVYFKTETGSLAETIGAEGIEARLSWTVIRKFQYVLDYEINKIEFQDGTVRLDWDKANENEFRYYILTKSDQSGYYHVFDKIYDNDHNYLYDSTYCGDKTYYQISYYFETDSAYIERVHSSNMPFESYPLNYQLTPNECGEIEITFDYNPYYKNIYSAKVFNIHNDGDEFEIFSDDGMKITSLNYGVSYDFYIKFFSNIPDEYKLNTNSKRETIYNRRYTDITGYRYYPEGSYSYVFYNNDLKRIRKGTDLITANLKVFNVADPYDLKFSPDGNYLLVKNSESSEMRFYDMTALRQLKTRNIQDILPDVTVHLTYDLSNNGIALFASNSRLYLYDFLNDRLIGNDVIEALKYERFEKVKLSKDGKTILGNTETGFKVISYSESDGFIDLSPSLGATYNADIFCFDNYDIDRIYIHDSDKNSLICFDLAGFSKVYDFSLNDQVLCDIDLEHRKFLTIILDDPSNVLETMKIYNLDDLHLYKEIEGNFYSEQYIIFYNWIYNLDIINNSYIKTQIMNMDCIR